jgi:hypothetical protein
MTATTHTPGPWTFIESGDARIPDRIIGANGAPVVSGSIAGRDDAALIAAAPELLAALQAALDALDADATRAPMNPTSARAAQGWMRGKFGDQARAAIAKAIGSQP